MAKPKYKPGDLILEESPFAHAVIPDYVEKVCDFCLKLSENNFNLKKCANCKHVHYCGRDCQRKAWKEHKEECERLRKVSEKKEIEPVLLLLLRIFLKLKKGDDGTTMVDGSTRNFDSLMSKKSTLRRDAEVMSHFYVMMDRMQYAIELSNEHKLMLFDIYCKVRINMFGIGDTFQQFGIALFMKATVFEHACKANAERSLQNGKLCIRALQDIQDFQHVRPSYARYIDPISRRRQKVQNRFLFFCECDACARPTPEQLRIDALMESGIKCPNCSADIVLKSECPECKQKLDKTFRNEIRVLKFLMKSEQPSVKVIKMAMANLSLYNFIMVDFVQSRLTEFIRIEGAYEAALGMVDVLREILTPNDSLFANYLANLAHFEMHFLGVDEKKVIESHLEEALKILSIALGSEHPSTIEVKQMIQGFLL